MRGLRSLTLLVLAAFPVAAGGQGGAPAPPPTNALERVAEARAAKKISQRFDPSFKKYSRRYFGSAFDWR